MTAERRATASCVINVEAPCEIVSPTLHCSGSSLLPRLRFRYRGSIGLRNHLVRRSRAQIAELQRHLSLHFLSGNTVRAKRLYRLHSSRCNLRRLLRHRRYNLPPMPRAKPHRPPPRPLAGSDRGGCTTPATRVANAISKCYGRTF